MTQWRNDFRFKIKVNISTIIQTPPVTVTNSSQEISILCNGILIATEYFHHQVNLSLSDHRD
jgi:hypothetical protein